MAYDLISYCREIVSYSLDIGDGHGHGHGLVRLYTSAVHFHSFRFAGGSLTAGDRPPFSENVGFITLFYWFDFIIFERLVLILSTLFAGIGILRPTTSAVHLHSFRFAGGILTAGVRPPFSENVGFITLWIGLYSISSREYVIDVV
jgi:hypothetical protein